jgi:DNA-binding IscR family transcriptional regulator
MAGLHEAGFVRPEPGYSDGWMIAREFHESTLRDISLHSARPNCAPWAIASKRRATLSSRP